MRIALFALVCALVLCGPASATATSPVGKVAVTCLGDVVAVGASLAPVAWSVRVAASSGAGGLALGTSTVGPVFVYEHVRPLHPPDPVLLDVRAELYADGVLVAADEADCGLQG